MSAQYLPAFKQYLYVADDVVSDTTSHFAFYVADHPWGPWSIRGSYTTTPYGFYQPAIMPKSVSVDGGRNIYVVTAGSPGSPNMAYYTLVLLPLHIE